MSAKNIFVGLTWSMEAVSWIFDTNSTSFFIISDVANSIHGFVIFGLFVCRSHVMDSVITRSRSSNRFTSSLIGRIQDSQRNSDSNDDLMLKFLKDKRAGNG
ncbi:CLUMA_CG019789, isoform A [Clunio marinus]|uniref:CLUMA_CG019789, isoform A n=1 Tax=Clunio marinus TaxID=568069 RepID=A0A1J1J785_9DIPT|nr:CLUMA_CG019789, isoform A [Clunio marinus]